MLKSQRFSQNKIKLVLKNSVNTTYDKPHKNGILATNVKVLLLLKNVIFKYKSIDFCQFYLLPEQDFSRCAKSNISSYHIPDIFM